jgi:hypothetical protein
MDEELSCFLPPCFPPARAGFGVGALSTHSATNIAHCRRASPMTGHRCARARCGTATRAMGCRRRVSVAGLQRGDAGGSCRPVTYVTREYVTDRLIARISAFAGRWSNRQRNRRHECEAAIRRRASIVMSDTISSGCHGSAPRLERRQSELARRVRPCRRRRASLLGQGHDDSRLLMVGVDQNAVDPGGKRRS